MESGTGVQESLHLFFWGLVSANFKRKNEVV